jgi:hypothetical protein
MRLACTTICLAITLAGSGALAQVRLRIMVFASTRV